MSAWIVADRHIDLLVAAIVRSEIVPQAGTDHSAIGHELLEENTNSVNYRYSEQTPVSYTFQPISLPDLATAAGVMYLHNAFASYSYQACEHPEWKDSRANAWTQSMLEHLSAALRSFGGTHSDLSGWVLPGLDRYKVGGWSVGSDYSPEALLKG